MYNVVPQFMHNSGFARVASIVQKARGSTQPFELYRILFCWEFMHIVIWNEHATSTALRGLVPPAMQSFSASSGMPPQSQQHSPAQPKHSYNMRLSAGYIANSCMKKLLLMQCSVRFRDSTPFRRRFILTRPTNSTQKPKSLGSRDWSGIPVQCQHL